MINRIVFSNGEQRNFLNLVKTQLNCFTIKDILQFGIDLSYSTLKNYYHEDRRLPEDLFNDLCYLAKIYKNNLKFQVVEGNIGQIMGGRKGIMVLQNRYSDKIKIWRKKGFINSPIKNGINKKKILEPKIDSRLAEIIGVYLGDGTLTKYQLKISGDKRYDLDYYSYLNNLFEEVFGIHGRIVVNNKTNQLTLVICSKEVSTYFNTFLGFGFGNKIKNKSRIPNLILDDKNLRIDVLRGLIDSDGSISRRGRNGSQFCLNFTNYNLVLLDQVEEILKELGIFGYRGKYDVGTNKWGNILKYFKIVGSSNIKHIIYFDQRERFNKSIYKNEVVGLINQNIYKGLKLPFKMSGRVS